MEKIEEKLEIIERIMTLPIEEAEKLVEPEVEEDICCGTNRIQFLINERNSR